MEFQTENKLPFGPTFALKPEVAKKVEALANDLIKSHRDHEDLTDEEKNFLKDWFEILKLEYSSYV